MKKLIIDKKPEIPKMSIDVVKKGTPTEIKRLKRRNKVLELICAGYKSWQISQMLGVCVKTIERDSQWIFGQQDIKKISEIMLEQVEWSLRQAHNQFIQAVEKKEKAMWLHLYNQINRTKATYLKRQDIYIQNNTVNVITHKTLEEAFKRIRGSKEEQVIDV